MHRLLVCFGNAEFGRLGLGHGLQSAVAVPRVCLALAKYDLQARVRPHYRSLGYTGVGFPHGTADRNCN